MISQHYRDDLILVGRFLVVEGVLVRLQLAFAPKDLLELQTDVQQVSKRRETQAYYRNGRCLVLVLDFALHDRLGRHEISWLVNQDLFFRRIVFNQSAIIRQLRGQPKLHYAILHVGQ